MDTYLLYGLPVLSIVISLILWRFRGKSINFHRNHGLTKALSVKSHIFNTLTHKGKGWVKIYVKNFNQDISKINHYFNFDKLVELIKSDNFDITVIVDEKPDPTQKGGVSAYKLLKRYEVEHDRFNIITLSKSEKSTLQNDLKKEFKEIGNTPVDVIEEGHFIIDSSNCYRFEYNEIEHKAIFCIPPIETDRKKVEFAAQMVNQLNTYLTNVIQRNSNQISQVNAGVVSQS